MGMTVKEAILTLNANAVIACERAEFDSATVKIVEDALDTINDALKEQEAKRPVVRKKNGYWDFVCPICGSRDEELFREWKYCPYCGQEMKWE